MQQTFSISNLFSHRAQRAGGYSTVTPPPREIISFGGGMPDSSSLPLRQLSSAATTALVSYGNESLQYGSAFGSLELRGLIARREAALQGITADPGQVVITNGGSQSLDLVCDTFLDPGDVVLIEEPSFSLSIAAIRSYGVELVGIPVDEEGMDTARLAEELGRLRAEGRPVKLLYTIPDFHNPTGARLSLERRRAIAGLAQDHGFLIVEDTAYSELRYEGEALPSLLSLAEELTVQASSFSKTIGPGLRLGWVLAGDPQVAERIASVRRDMGSSPFLSRMVASFINEGQYQPHLSGVVTIYRGKRDLLHQSLTQHCADFVAWTPPQGGFFFWLQLTSGRDARDLLPLAREEGVSFIPGSHFLLEERPTPYIRLAFSFLSPPQIRQGVERLARALQRFEGSD